jgi:hypothetical protein
VYYWYHPTAARISQPLAVAAYSATLVVFHLLADAARKLITTHTGICEIQPNLREDRQYAS